MWNGVTDWKNLGDINAMYPFQGYEWVMVLVAVVFWLWWHVRTIRDENREMEDAARRYRELGVEACMSPDGKARRPEGDSLG